MGNESTRLEARVGEVWYANGLFEYESISLVRIMEIFPSGSIDVNYEINPKKPADLRILPPKALVQRVIQEGGKK